MLLAGVREDKASPFLADSAKRRISLSWRELLSVCGAMEGIYSGLCSLLFIQGVCA